MSVLHLRFFSSKSFYQLIYTDAYLCDPKILQQVTRFLQAIDKLLIEHFQRERFELPPDAELVLELSGADGTEDYWSYYFVNHVSKTLFWLHNFDPESILFGIGGVDCNTHIRKLKTISSLLYLTNFTDHQLQSCYWDHWETFPHNRVVSSDVFQELTGLLVYDGIGE